MFANAKSPVPARLMILFRRETTHQRVEEALGMRVARATDFPNSAPRSEELAGTGALFLDHTGVAIVADTSELSVRLYAAMRDANSRILAVEPVRALRGSNSADYWRGYRDGIGQTVEKLLESYGPFRERDAWRLTVFAEDQATWGLQAVKAVPNAYTGNGVRVAVLDSGFDFNHPDFLNHGIEARAASFLAGEPVQDANGHGTHCAGTLCGPAIPQTLPRYGVAPGVELYAGKVLDQNLDGDDAGLQAGINWAVANGCRIVSMSLGAPVQRGEAYSPVYEGAAQNALAAGTLLIAAAGNDSWRPRSIAPVQSPADCPSIMSVGAVNSSYDIANFSDAGLNSNARVDLVAPGVNVYSSWRLPDAYRRKNGTSMATPHVAGVAALYAEAENLVGLQLWARLIQTAQYLPLSAEDAGAGLVQAP